MAPDAEAAKVGAEENDGRGGGVGEAVGEAAAAVADAGPALQDGPRHGLRDVLVAFAPLGFVAFGGPAAHIGLLQTQFVEKRKWLDNEHFVEVLAVAQALPGPTSTQLVTALGAVRAGIPGGVLAFLLFSLPGLVVMTGVAMASRTYLTAPALPDYLLGFPPAATALVFIAVDSLGRSVCGHKVESVRKLKTGLAAASAILTVLLGGEPSVISPRWSTVIFPGLLLAGGLVTLADSRRAGRLEHYFSAATLSEQAESRSILRHIGISVVQGVVMLLLAVALLIALVALRAVGVIPGEGYLAMFEANYRIGSIIYGGGQVVLPMTYSDFVDTAWVSSSQFFQGFTLAQALPGPLFNFSAWLGAVYLGLPGALVAWLGLFLPGELLILAFLPFWAKARRVAWFKCFLAGVNAAAIGLIVAACVQLYQLAVVGWASCACFLITGTLVAFYDMFVPLAILFGGLLGFLLSPTVLSYAQDFA
jgi:chromate transporter